MAFYDVNAAIDKPNLLNSFRQGQQYGQQLDQQRQAAQDQNALRGLAPQVIQGDPGAYDQAAAIDPAAAQKYQGAGDDQLRRMKGAIDFIDTASKSGNPQAVEAAYQQVKPYLARFGQEPPATFAEAAPKFQEAKARIAMLGQTAQGRVQSTYVDDQGQRVAIMADGTQKVLGGNDSGMSQQTISIPGPDGRPRQFTFDKRTGNYVPAGEGGQSSALGAPPAAPGTGGNPLPQGGTAQIVDAIAEQANRMIAAGVPAEQVDAWAQSQQGAQPPSGNSFQNTQAMSPGPSAFVGRSPEEQAALTEQAKTGVQLANLPQELQLRTDAAIRQAVGADVGKAQAERAAQAQMDLPKTTANANELLGLIDQLKAAPGTAELTGLSGYNPLNRIPGSGAQDAQVLLDQVKGKAFLQAFQSLKGAGAITETEGQKATEAIARLNTKQSDESFIKALDDLSAVVRTGVQRAEQQAQGGQVQAQVRSAPQPGIEQDGYRFKGGNPADPQNWERL